MHIDRRRFLQVWGGGAAALLGCGPRDAPPPASATAAARAPSPAPATIAKKKILVLGGTGYAGPPIVEAAVRRGHEVTLFNRGKSAPGLFPNVETILGDRVMQLDLLKGRSWDAVVDTWAPGPTLVRRAAELLRDRVDHYVYFSTISVYRLTREPLHEGSPLLTLPPGVDVKDIKAIDEKNYGPLKALAERAAEDAMPGRTTSVRAGLLVGPGDPTDRFLYWPLRARAGGPMIAPGKPEDPMQLVDVRDVGAWIVTAIEARHVGAYNAVGPQEPRIGAILDAVREGAGGDARPAWIPHAFLEKNGAAGWESFPVAIDPDGDESGFARVSCARAIAKGLRFRPLAGTTRDAMTWWAAQTAERRAKERPGITREREAELLRSFLQARG